MDWINEFFAAMSRLQQVYWGIALIGSAIFVVIFLLTFIGADSDGELSGDADVGDADGGVGFQFFTFKNVIAFFTIFGWTGIVCLDYGLSSIITLGIATVAGLIMMVLTSLLFFWVNRLAESGTLKINNAIGAVGEVYLPIGANRSSIGKVQIRVQGSLRELEALTDEDVEISTRTLVEVTDIVSAEILLVKLISKK
ncbi:MAG: hypothetical protein ACPGEG_04040 [Salibacteraceae bacterium]